MLPRALAITGLLLASFFLFIDLAAQAEQVQATVPICGGVSWLDCETVLTSRYSKWLGMPVSAGAVVLYLTVLIAMPKRAGQTSAVRSRVIWFAIVCIFGAAAWFTVVQLLLIGRVCTLCMIEHGIGILLCLVLLGGRGTGVSLRQLVSLPTVAALSGLAGLVLGQLFISPAYTQPIEWMAETEGRWIEPAAADRQIRVLGDQVVLNRDARPVFGGEAEHYLIEVVDFTCSICARVSAVVEQARPRFGDRLAVVVVWFPSDADCNPLIDQTPEHAELACELARLAAAVWLADRTAYPPFHHWLFEHQESLTLASATREAERRVGPIPLRDALSDPRVDLMIQRDIQLTEKLNLPSLPGLLINGQRLTQYPADSHTMNRVLQWAMEER